MTIKFEFTMPFYHINGQTARMREDCSDALQILKDAGLYLSEDYGPDDETEGLNFLCAAHKSNAIYDSKDFVRKVLRHWLQWHAGRRELHDVGISVEVKRPDEGIWFRSIVDDNRDVAVNLIRLFMDISGMRDPWSFTWSEERHHAYSGGVTVVYPDNPASGYYSVRDMYDALLSAKDALLERRT